MKFCFKIAAALLVSCMAVAPLHASVYSNFNSFEVDTAGWTGAVRVASGTDGITSATGGFHAQATSGDFTNFGGYNFGAGNNVPTAFKAYTTKLDIYLDVNKTGFPNDQRFDYTSAISNAAGAHRRDFVYSGAFFNAASTTGPGAGSDRFIFSASNTVPGWPANPGRSPIAITSTGWYTFEHSFYNNGGVLAVAMTIYDKLTNAVQGTWTLSDPSDLIGLVGGSRYGWFATLDTDYGYLPIDNAELRTADTGIVPEPMTIVVWSVLGMCGSAFAWRSRQRAEG
jgi:hypothetical protein